MWEGAFQDSQRAQVWIALLAQFSRASSERSQPPAATTPEVPSVKGPRPQKACQDAAGSSRQAQPGHWDRRWEALRVPSSSCQHHREEPHVMTARGQVSGGMPLSGSQQWPLTEVAAELSHV